MKFPYKYLRNLKPYKLASHKFWTVKPEERPKILKLDWNESTIPPSPKAAEYLNKSMRPFIDYNWDLKLGQWLKLPETEKKL